MLYFYLTSVLDEYPVQNSVDKLIILEHGRRSHSQPKIVMSCSPVFVTFQVHRISSPSCLLSGCSCDPSPPLLPGSNC